MPLNDYSYAFAMGYNCTPVHQLREEAERVGMPIERIKGPFDWISVPMDPAIEVLKNRFDGFFRPEESDIIGTLGCRWQVLNRHGFLSVHNLSRAEGETAVSPQAWARFGEVQKQRIATWQAALADPDARVLIVRQECPGWADQPAAVASLASTIASQARADVTIAAVAFGSPATHDHPMVRGFGVERSWPEGITALEIDWTRDYGWGIAWKGHAETWNRFWQQI